uniref:hypothetical protein n=1 Tax=Microcystis aeruginosa TaxID=1126 RepID=UPI000934F9DC|nr:hypothetical protein [Microcystis aeruginosa]
MRPSLLLALILLDFGWGATGQKRFVFCIPCYILNLELLIDQSVTGKESRLVLEFPSQVWRKQNPSRLPNLLFL